MIVSAAGAAGVRNHTVHDELIMQANLYSSNRLEKLAERLAGVLEKPLSDPMATEYIMVQGLGMKRWISLELAGHIGVWANCRFLFPNELIREIFQLLFPDIPKRRFFDPEMMTWRVMGLLPACAGRPAFREVTRYLSGSDDLKVYQLASRIVNIFDQYLTFRPDMIMSWERGEDAGWQAGLWRMLMAESEEKHPPALREAFFENLRKGAVREETLPERLSLFGISSLPPFHLEVIMALSEYIEINIFHLNPSDQYWAHILSRQEIEKVVPDSSAVEDLHLEGNALLASLGHLGRDFLGSLMDYDIIDVPDFEDPGRDTILHTVQSDILRMIDRGQRSEEREELTEEEFSDDTSIQVHSCHNPMREVEVLHDVLLDLFNEDTTLEPRDIIVMTPDLETYTPYVQAVFGTVEGEMSIPFAVAGRSLRRSRTVEAFFSILELAKGRFGAGTVLDILECDDVRRRFDMEPADIDLARRWVTETRIRWGIDGDHRKRNGLPPYGENTWQAGIERLLLGYALPGRGERMFHDILPYDDIEGGDALILGKFVSYVETLSGIVLSVEEPKTLQGWSEILFQLLESLFSPDEESAVNLQNIRDYVQRLGTLEEESGFHGEISIAVIRAFLERCLIEAEIRSEYVSGRVTFTSMLPMSGIPAKVICLIGMNDSAFPRMQMSPGFDLIAASPRRGDRSLRNEDRYLFLQAILSAREKLHISYVGREMQDNSEIPPSVLVSELMDYLEQTCTVSGKPVVRHLVMHRLQGFSTGYFTGGELFSYSAENCEACRTMIGSRREPEFLVRENLPHVDEIDAITLEELIQFFLNPARYLITRRLGIYLDERRHIVEEREPFSIEGLERYWIEQQICDRSLKNGDIDSLYRVLRAEGILPHGIVGEYGFRRLVPDLSWFSEHVRTFMRGERRDPIDIDCDLSGVRLTGTIDDIWDGGKLIFRYANGKAKDRLRSWITHCALTIAADGGEQLGSVLICRDRTWETGAVAEPRQILEKLITLYRRGLSEPLIFFPETSFAFVQASVDGATRDRALERAASTWRGSDFAAGEGDNPYTDLLFRGSVAFDEAFAAVAESVYGSLLAYQREVKR